MYFWSSCRTSITSSYCNVSTNTFERVIAQAFSSFNFKFDWAFVAVVVVAAALTTTEKVF